MPQTTLLPVHNPLRKYKPARKQQQKAHKTSCRAFSVRHGSSVAHRSSSLSNARQGPVIAGQAMSRFRVEGKIQMMKMLWSVWLQ